jgi:hypothetical protein
MSRNIGSPKNIGQHRDYKNYRHPYYYMIRNKNPYWNHRKNK